MSRADGAARIEAPLLSKQRYVLLAFVLGAILVGFTLQAALTSAFAQFAVPDNRIGGLVATSTAIAIVGAVATLIGLVRSRRAMTFAGEVVGELLRVTWPSRDEALRASTTVVLTTVFTASLLAVYDFTWKNLADLILFTER
jgi:preprotein translocase subunit SecE